MTGKAGIHNREKIVFSINIDGKTWQLYLKMKLKHVLSLHTHTYTHTHTNRLKSKYIKDLNVRPDPIKLLEKTIGRTQIDINCINIFFKSIS